MSPSMRNLIGVLIYTFVSIGGFHVSALKPEKDGDSHSLVYIFKNNKPVCAGGVLAENLIITASSCFQNDQKSGFQEFTIQFTATASHDENSKYKIKQVDDDNQDEKRLAIVTLTKKMTQGEFKKLKISSKPEILIKSLAAKGHVGDLHFSDLNGGNQSPSGEKSIKFSLMESGRCKSQFSKQDVDDNQICAVPMDTHENITNFQCLIGSPLVYNNETLGIATYGSFEDKLALSPIVYTKLSKSLKFIDKAIQMSEKKPKTHVKNGNKRRKVPGKPNSPRSGLVNDDEDEPNSSEEDSREDESDLEKKPDSSEKDLKKTEYNPKEKPNTIEKDSEKDEHIPGKKPTPEKDPKKDQSDLEKKRKASEKDSENSEKEQIGYDTFPHHPKIYLKTPNESGKLPLMRRLWLP